MAVPFTPQGKDGTRYSFDSLFLKVGPSGQMPDLFGIIKGHNINLFFGANQSVGKWLVLALVSKFKDLHTDSLVYHSLH